VGAEFFHADSQTDGRTGRQSDKTKLTVAFRNLANAPKHNYKLPQWYLSCSLSRKRLFENSERRLWNFVIPQNTEYQFTALNFVTYLKLDGFKRLTVSS